MAEIKLKVIGAAGDTLAVSRAGERISLVHTAPYADGDWIALECDEPGLYCVVQLEDTMPPALVYIRERGLDFPIPPADNRVNYSPRSFTGTCHLLRARLATAEEVAARRNLAFNPYDCHGSHGFYPHASSQFGKLLEDLDMPHIRFHDLRHTAATNTHQLTGDFYTVGEVLGHTLAGIGVSLGLSMNFEAVTARYVDVRLERKKEVLDAYHGAVKQADPAKAEKAEPKKAKSAAKKKSSDLEL